VSQFRIVGGLARLEVEVRGVDLEVVLAPSFGRWGWTVRAVYDDRQEPLKDYEPTWAAAYRAALRACDGMAPFKRRSK
jgi:hypothetical protein